MQRRARPRDVDAVKASFGVDVGLVRHDDLDFSPLLSMVWCRLFYKLIPDVFPSTVEGRAAYWKRFYNTVSGSGSVDDYIENVGRFGV